MGDPTKEDTYIGPMARADLRDKVHEAVEKALQGGAKLMCGGKKPGIHFPCFPATSPDARSTKHSHHT
jgi:succinate-semialdehyde dehydrogenase/glutarate-semialdehyde dehydrogenase